MIPFYILLFVTSCFGLIPLDSRDVINTPDMKWTGADFSWPDSTTRALLKNSGKFVTKNNIATRAAISGDTFFFAFPRYKKGDFILNLPMSFLTNFLNSKAFPRHLSRQNWSVALAAWLSNHSHAGRCRKNQNVQHCSRQLI